MKYRTSIPRRNTKTFIASLLTYVMLTSQLAPLALGFDRSLPTSPDKSSASEGLRTQSAAELSVKQDNAAAPVPVPLRVSSMAVAPIITATKTDSFADADGDSKAEPGETITYSITLTNTGPDPATNLTLNDTVDPNTNIVAGSAHSTPIAVNDAYNVLGNVRIQVPDGVNDLLANDTDPENAGNSNAGLTITTLAGDATAPFAGTSTNGGQVTATTGNGAFEYNPAPGFTGSDTFTYTTTDSTGGGTSTATVTLTVTGLIWFVNAAAGAGGNGRLTAPFNCYTGTSGGGQTCLSDTAVDDPGDIIFLFSGAYTGGNVLLNNQRLVGQGATDTLANVGGVAVPTFSDALPSTGGASPTMTTVIAATNAVPLGQGNLLRGFTIGNTTGAKISGNAFGTLTVGNNTLPDMTLNGTGMALNLTNGTFAATSAFTGVTTTSSTAQGISLVQAAGTVALGSTTVSGSTTQGILVQQSTADINFGNTIVGTGVAGTGGTNGVSLQNNSAGTRTFGTLTIQNINGPANSAFVSGAGGGNTVVGTTNIPNVPGTGNGIDIQNLATGTSVAFAGTTVNKASPGSLVNLVSNVGNVSFLSLSGTNTNGAGLTGSENTGSITVTNNAGSLTTTLGPAVSLTKAGNPATPITLNFTALSSTNSGTQGVNLDRVSGNLTTTTTTVTNSTGTGIQVQNTVTGGTMNFGTTAVNGSGNTNVDATGTGVFLNANAGNITFGDLDIAPDNLERAFQSTAGTGTITTTSGDISASGNVTLDIVGVSVANRTALAMTLNNLDSLNSNGLGVNFNFISGNFTVNDATLATSISNPAGVGLQVLNSTGGTMNFGNSSVTGSGGISVSLGTAGNGNASNITFADLDMSPDATQRALVAIDNTGTLTVTSGDMTTSGAGNRAVEIDGPAGRTPINIQFTTITTAGASNSISLVDVSGTKFQVTGTTQINTRAGTGVFVDNSTATNIQFATVNIPNPNAAGGDGFHVEDSSSAVTVATATISDANRTVAQADGGGIPASDGDGNAIFLRSNTAAFTLNGGTLSNCGNDCIDLRNSPALVLSAVNITSPGIDETGATGAGAGGHGISLYNLTGTSTITGGTISGFNTGNRDGIYLLNDVATALTLTVTNAIFQNSTGNRGFGIQGNAAANMTVNVTSCTFQNISGTALQSIAGASPAGSTSTVNVTVQTSTFQNSPLNGKTNLLGSVGEAGKTTLSYQNNTFSNVFVTASTGEGLISTSNDGLLAGNQFALNITGNNINGVGSALNTCGGGATGCRGPLHTILVFIDDAGNVPGTIVIDNNTLTNVQQGGITLDAANTGAPSSAVNAKIINNCIGRLRVAGACTGATAAVGQGVGVTIQSGIRVERRRNNSPGANVLISGNTVRNGAGGAGSTLNSPGIFARTKANSNMSVTVTNNNVDTNLTGGVAELRFDTNANDAGDIVAPTQCDDITGNTLPAGGVIDINEVNGTHNVEQASVAAVNAANPSGATTADAGVTFGVACATPPAAPDPGDSIANIPTPETSAALPTAEPATAPHVAAASDSITSKPLVSSPPPEAKAVETKVNAFVGVTSGADGQKVGGDKLKQEKPNPTTNINPTPPVIVGDNITWNVGTLPAGQSVTITFQVTVDNPYTGPANVSNQGTVTADGGISVLTDDPAVAGPNNPTLTPIDVPPNITINDATAAEPPSGSASMLFTVLLSAPATGAVSVNFATADGGATPATGGTCAGGADYATTNGTVNFAVGEQMRTVAIPVCADVAVEPDETFLVNLSTPVNGIITDSQATGTITVNAPGTLLISELRTSGPSGSADEFVEIYNNTNSPHVVAATNGSTGYGVFKMGAGCNANPVLVGTIPNGTTIPARGHYLLVGSAYSLANYGGTGAAAGNLTMTSDIENDRNVSLFSTTNILALSTTTRFDAVGFSTNTGNVCDLQREGTNLGALLGSTLQYSFFRKLDTGTPQDTNDNAADFLFVDTAATLVAGAGQRLGAPGPENLASPLQRNATIKASLVDPGVASTAPPNRVRDLTSDPANNSTLGTLDIRRKFTNNTGAAVTRLRFRIVDITTSPQPGGTADLRARTSTQLTGVAVSGGGTITLDALTLESPPAQAIGGGYNSTLSAGVVTLATPLAAGANLNFRFLLGVQQNGSFRFFINVEALP